MELEGIPTEQRCKQTESTVQRTAAEVSLLRDATQFLGRFRILIKLAQTHERYNQAVREAAEALYSLLWNLFNEVKDVRFDIVHSTVYFNATRLGAGISDFSLMEFFVQEMTKRDLGSIVFEDTVEIDDLLAFAFVFAGVGPGTRDPYEEIQRLIALEGISGIRAIRLVQEEMTTYEEDLHLAPEQQARRSLISALHLIKDAVNDGIVRGKVNPRKIKRVIESIVDTVISDEHSMLALTAIRNYDEYTYHHSFNVCIYSVALANRLGLPRKTLAEIGAAALFHDVGKTDIPQSILNKIGNLTEDEWKVLQQHTVAGVKHLSQLKKLDRVTLRSIIVAFCHHLNLDSTGYPQTKQKIKPDAVSRIVRIADIFEALTSPRSYRARPFTKAQALEMITERAGTALDATLCMLFADVVGMEPESSDTTSQAKSLEPQS